ncbi:hypothetical protein Tco_1094359 [Tanacetum coccineum]|uniref:Reverse transcriptase domain-containing protein n=1 Tax=Tanacetum coccineum TaxID=301880 RepID=A0ABQ5IF99_9ASTR
MATDAMSMVYVLTTPTPEKGENATVDQIRRRNKWDNDDYVCRESGDCWLQIWIMESFDNTINQDEEHTNSPIITNSKLEISDEFLKILQDNAFNGMDGGDVTDHIANVLEITEWIKIPNVEINKLRLYAFSKSLKGDAQTWWNNEINETTIT